MEEIIIIGKVLLLAWLVSRFEPISWLLDLLPDKLGWNIFSLLFRCSKCLGFWIGLLMIQDIWMAIICSFLMMLYEKTIGRWENKIRLN